MFCFFIFEAPDRELLLKYQKHNNFLSFKEKFWDLLPSQSKTSAELHPKLPQQKHEAKPKRLLKMDVHRSAHLRLQMLTEIRDGLRAERQDGWMDGWTDGQIIGLQGEPIQNEG